MLCLGKKIKWIVKPCLPLASNLNERIWGSGVPKVGFCWTECGVGNFRTSRNGDKSTLSGCSAHAFTDGAPRAQL